MAAFAFGAHLKLVLVSFVPWLIMCCSSGPIISFLIWCFLDPQSFSNFSFNCHIKHNTAVLPFGIVLKCYFWNPARSFDLPFSCFESTGCHQRPHSAVSHEILFHPWVLCPKIDNIPKVKRASPFTDGAAGQRIQVHSPQLHSNANKVFYPSEGLYKPCSFQFLTAVTSYSQEN